MGRWPLSDFDSRDGLGIVQIDCVGSVCTYPLSVAMVEHIFYTILSSLIGLANRLRSVLIAYIFTVGARR